MISKEQRLRLFLKFYARKLGGHPIAKSLWTRRLYLCSQVGINLFLRCILLNQWRSPSLTTTRAIKRRKKKRRRKRESSAFLFCFSKLFYCHYYLELSCVGKHRSYCWYCSQNPSLFFFFFLFFSWRTCRSSSSSLFCSSFFLDKDETRHTRRRPQRAKTNWTCFYARCLIRPPFFVSRFW